MKKMNKKGFTIVELVIVIAVIAILSAVLIPTFSGVVANAKDTAAKADAKAAYQEYLADKADEGDVADDFIYEYEAGTIYVTIVDGVVTELVKGTGLTAQGVANSKFAVSGKTVTATVIATGAKLYTVTVSASA